MKIFLIKVHPPFTVCPEEEWCKREYRERWLVRQIYELGHQTALYLLTNKREVWVYPDSEYPNNIPIKFYPVDNPSIAKQQHTSIIMLNELEKEKPDVIIWKGLDYKLSSWIRENLSYKPKIVFIVGGKVADKYLNEANIVLAETQEQIDIYFKNKISFILPKSLDLEIFKPNKEKDFDIVSVGTFEERKNHKVIIPLGKFYSIVLLGDGHLKAKMIQLAKDLDVLHNVHFLGNQSTDKVAEYISKSKVMFHPSIWEGFPRTIIEALSCEVPIVANKHVVKDLIKSGRHGLLVEEGEYQEALHSILKFSDMREEMGSRGRELVKNSYDKKSTISVLKNMLSVLEKE
jgi:glycosyltransferase involved in cell wall biosynthesis